MSPTQTDWQICLVTPLKQKKRHEQNNPGCSVCCIIYFTHVFSTCILWVKSLCEPPKMENVQDEDSSLRRRVSPPQRIVGIKAGSRCGLGGSWCSRLAWEDQAAAPLAQLISVFMSVVLINCVSFVRRGLVLRDPDNKLISHCQCCCCRAWRMRCPFCHAIIEIGWCLCFPCESLTLFKKNNGVPFSQRDIRNSVRKMPHQQLKKYQMRLMCKDLELRILIS